MTPAALSTTLAVSHLPVAAGAGAGVAVWLAAGGQDVGGSAGGWGGVVDAADFGHAFAVAFLAFGQPRRQLGGGLGRGCGCGGAQRVGAHDDAFAVTGQHEHVARAGPGGLAAFVEVVEVAEVARGPLREPFDLAFAQGLPGPALDRGDGCVEGTACALDGGEAA